MGTIIGICCEMIGGHWFKPWEPFAVPESWYADFEHTQCKVCRQGYVRPRLRPVLSDDILGRGLHDWHP